MLRNAENVTPLQNIVRVSRMLQWNPAVMCVCVRDLNMRLRNVSRLCQPRALCQVSNQLIRSSVALIRSMDVSGYFGGV